MSDNQTPDAVGEAVDALHQITNLSETEIAQEPRFVLEMAQDALATLDSRAGDAGEGQEALEQRAVQIITEERGAEWATPKIVRAMMRFRNEAATPAPAVDAVPAGEVLRMWQVKGPCEATMWETNRTSGQFADPIAAVCCALSLPFPAALSHGEGRK